MANRQSRSPGGFDRVTAVAPIGDVPDFAVDTGAAARVLAQLGGSLSGRLGQMADQAAQAEGTQAGLNAGEAAGARFIAKETGDGAAAKRKGGNADIVVGPGDVSPGPASLNSAPLQLRHDNTIRGDAFDAAAIKTYGWRFQEGLTNDLATAAAANKDSPGGFEKALAGIQQTYRADATDPAIREIFDQTLAEKVAPVRLAIRARYEAQVKAQAKSAAVDGVNALSAELERNAYNLGANPAADQMLAPQIARAMTSIDHEAHDGTFTPKEAAAAKKSLSNRIVNARTTGTFDALPTPSAKQDFALGVMKNWASGEGPYASMSMKDAKALSDHLYQKATVAATQLTAAQKAQKAEVQSSIKEDVASVAGSGQGLDPQQSGLTPDRVQLLVGQEGYDKWQADRAGAQKLWQATTGMELEAPAELAQRVAALKPAPGQADFAEAQKAYAAAQHQQNTILVERKTDPLGQANRGGLVKLGAIDTTSPDGLVKSLQQRTADAKVVSGTYGTPLTFFRPAEKTSLTTALWQNPTLLPAFARAADQAFGDDAGRALGELSDSGPALAHSAGIALATGDAGVADDVSRVLTGRHDKSYTAKMPTDNVLGDAAGRILGATIGSNDKARGAIVDTANLLFEKDANTLGFDAGAVNKPGSAADGAYRRALDRALGAHTVDGVQYGGMSDVNGSPIVAPSFLPADEPQKLISQFRESDLQFLPPIQSGNGVPVKASDVRGASLVTIGDGLYRVALGDPQGLDPQYVTGKDGRFWTLDLKQLEQIHSLPSYVPRAPIDKLIDFVKGGKADAP